ncbi:MAG: DUF7281 domain-containing protein [Plesiomonas sp.]|uniref:DUF7281 domain-containing protein n=2 Tax=Plesiomonas sp. TaxID=2486279 RepID=UPI003F361E1D
MSHALRAALRKLRESTAQTLPASALTSAQRRALESFAQATNSVRLKTQGRGVVFEVTQPAVIERQWYQLVPREDELLSATLPNRARNIATTGSSKSAQHGHDTHYLLLKAAAGAVWWQNTEGHQLDLRYATDHQGAAVLAINPQNHWYTEGSLWLVENQALFDRLDWLPDTDNITVAYYSGQLPNTVIEWLLESPRASAIWFFPDYDGVGLLNYARIKSKLANAVRFWLMPDWLQQLTDLGSQHLWQSSQREFNAMLQHIAYPKFEPELKHLIDTMQRQGKALEQEAVWLEVAEVLAWQRINKAENSA